NRSSGSPPRYPRASAETRFIEGETHGLVDRFTGFSARRHDSDEILLRGGRRIAAARVQWCTVERKEPGTDRRRSRRARSCSAQACPGALARLRLATDDARITGSGTRRCVTGRRADRRERL